MAGKWRAVYRLQLGPDLGFAGARELVPYLRDLGVSHLYLSPSLQARSGSTHGYDVIDPAHLSDDLGGEDEFRALAETAAQAGLGILLDIVPNHMATGDENPFWRDPLWRAKFFDVDWRTGAHRRFFDVGELAGVRQEDPEVFEATHAKVISLVREGLVDGVRIDHPDGLANPAGYLRRLERAGVEHVWVEKIVEPGERLRSWPVEGTTGYEFANDATALFVDPAAEEPLTALYREVTGFDAPWDELAHDCKLEQARTTFDDEVDRLYASLGEAGEGVDVAAALAAFHVYRTYVEPEAGHVEEDDRAAVEQANLPPELVRILLLEQRGHDAFVTRFQQTSPPVMAKGVEDTAFYRYNRLVCLNEVGGDPSRFSLSADEFHAANLQRAARFPRHLLATTTHDTKRSGDVRSRLAAISWLPHEWAAAVHGWEEARPGDVHPNDAYLVYQTLVGAWPLTRDRLDGYLEKALREGKERSNWLEPDAEYERRVHEFAWELHDRIEPFVRRVAPFGERISLAMTLLKLTVPGVPDVYQGDELELLALVDPDNRRPVDWEERREALSDPSPKLRVIREALALRARRPGAFEGAYEPVEAGPETCAFERGGEVAVAVALRNGSVDPAVFGAGWRHVLALDGLALLERA